MSNFVTSWILELVDKVTAPISAVTKSVEESEKQANKLQKALDKISAMDFYALAQSSRELSNMLNELSAPGIAFNTQMHEVQAITGLAGNELDRLGQSARRSAKVFGVDASQMLESYQGVIARFGPNIASSTEAMESMGNSIGTLSKLMGGDSVAAMDALTTAMLQYGVDISDPIAASKEMERMMNVMAAAGNEGASEVDMTSEALKQAGVQALNANVAFEETNAALQILAEGGITGSEAGIKLRNVLSKMAGEDVIPKEAADKLRALGVNYDIVSDKTIPFTDRLRELKKAQGDATIMAQIFGIQNDAAAQILLNNIDAQDELTEKITGTSAATESANIIMSSYQETINRIKAFFSDLGISIFGVTQYILPLVNGLAGGIFILANFANATKAVRIFLTTLKSFPVVGSLVKGATSVMTLGVKGFSLAIKSIPIIGWIAAIIAALGALAYHFWNTSAEFRGVVLGVWEAVKTIITNIGNFIGETLAAVKRMLMNVFNPKNWFNSNYSVTDDLNAIANIAREYGEKVGNAFREGQEKGRESFAKEKGTNEENSSAVVGVTGGVIPPEINGGNNLDSESNSGVYMNRDKPKAEDLKGLSISGSGGGRSITMNVTMTNNFKGSGQEEAMKIVRQLSDRLADAAAAI